MKKKKILKKLGNIFSDLMHIQHPSSCDPPGSVMYNSCCCHLCSALNNLKEINTALTSDINEKIIDSKGR